MGQVKSRASNEPAKFAAFDIDGTIIRWQLYHAISDALIRSGHFDPAEFTSIKQARMAWKRREKASSFKEYEQSLVGAYDKAIRNVSYKDFMAAVDESFEEYKQQTYTYTRSLISQLKQQGFKLFAISASQQEIVQLFAKHYGFDDYGGSIYENDGHKFTGQKHVLRSTEKPKLIEKLVSKHGLRLAGSIAVGDSDSDIPMLELVEHPIAFNPNDSLLAHAKTKQWKIVLERKSQVYELEYSRGKYQLA
jgi:HAD superfamily hydrolase (TIGR01490 family)